MYACYLLSLFTFLFLITGFIQSFLAFKILQANHVTFMILTSILYSFTETLVIFFFVGTGVSIREYSESKNLGTGFRQRSLAVKKRVYPPLLLNMLWMVILFVLVGAVDTQRISAWVYQILFVYCIVDYARIKWIQNSCFQENTQIILEMSGVKR